MDFVSLKHADDRVSFAQAVQRGLGRDRGLYFPERIEPLDDVDGLLALPFVERSARLLAQLTGLSLDRLGPMVEGAFDFPLDQVEVPRVPRTEPVAKGGRIAHSGTEQERADRCGQQAQAKLPHDPPVQVVETVELVHHHRPDLMQVERIGLQ